MSATSPEAFALTLHGGESPPGEGGLLVGKIVAERYEILDFLGAGGMGEVYRARDRELDELIALKVLHAQLAQQPELVERFRQEVKLARRVTHRGVARTFELGAADGLRFLTMEYVVGESLSRMLARRGRLSAEACTRLGADVCDALEAAHDVGVVHRDIKPDNILVTAASRAVVTDFGVARLAGDGSKDGSGTPGYMAPEQVRGEAPGPRTDLYALGATLFEACTGRLPFEAATPLAMMIARLSATAPDPRKLVADLPEAFAAVVVRALATDPGERFASASEMREELLALGRRSMRPAGLEIEARSFGPTPLTTIELVGAPRAPAGVQYLLSALAEELTLRIGRIPRVRVVSGQEETASVVLGWTAVAGGARVVATALATATGETLWSGRIPLEASRLADAAEAISQFLAVALEAPSPARTGTSEAMRGDVADLCQRARFHYHSAIGTDLARALELFDEARRRAPADPVVLAGWAMAFTRHANFSTEAPPSLEEAAHAAREALAGAPSRPEPHLAAGHVALHVGDPTLAARHFREALGLAPAWAEAHEWLGRMLLEAGFIDDAIRRLDAAIRLEPRLGSLRGELARAHALDGRWDEVDRLLAALAGPNGRIRGRWLSQARVAQWRGASEKLREIVEGFESAPTKDLFDPTFCRAVFACLADPASFSEHKELILERSAIPFASRRRSAFYSEVGAEVAMLGGDLDTGFALLAQSIECGLFDLHWLDACPTMRAARSDPRFAPLRAQVEARALAVLDALYGG